MTRKSKLLIRLRNHKADNTWTFAELETLLTQHGYTLRPGKGSHHVFSPEGDGVDIVVPRHGSAVKSAYVAMIRKHLLK